jgi:hypothetical protein
MKTRPINKERPGPFEQAGTWIRRIILPLGLIGGLLGTVGDITSIPGGSAAVIAFSAVFLLPALIWRFLGITSDAKGPLERIGKEIDEHRKTGKKLSFGGWRSLLALTFSGLTAFVGSFYLYGGLSGLFISIGMSTPVGAAIAATITLAFGCIYLFGSYASIKSFTEWLTGNQEKEMAKKLSISPIQQFIMTINRKIKEFTHLFTADFWKNHWDRALGAALAATFAGFCAGTLAVTLPVSAPAAIAMSCLFALGTYVGVTKPTQKFAEKAIRTVKRFILGTLLGRDTNHLHGHDKKEQHDNKVWNTLGFLKRALYGYLPAAVVSIAAMLPTVLSVAFPPAGLAILGLVICFGMYALAYPAIRSMVISRVKKSKGIPEAPEADEEAETEISKADADKRLRDEAIDLGAYPILGAIANTARATSHSVSITEDCSAEPHSATIRNKAL